ncbi:MAG: hypothetical protein E7330_04410 [Clostridiales bacterium]|nr:hypothetical protein [Clostridiales bacterium]
MRSKITAPIDPPAGCRFAPRCDYCKDICTRVTPDFHKVDKDHYAACHLYASKRNKSGNISIDVFPLFFSYQFTVSPIPYLSLMRSSFSRKGLPRRKSMMNVQTAWLALMGTPAR